MKKLEAECLWTHVSENKKKKKKERKEGKKEGRRRKKMCMVLLSGVQTRNIFFPIAAFNCALSNPFSFPLITSWEVINAQSS